MLQSVHVFEAQVLRKSLGSEFSKLRGDTQFSITHAAPPYVSLPAVSSIWSVARAGPGARGAAHHGAASANGHICRRRRLERDK